MKLPIDYLKPNPDNPRTIKDENFKKLVKSIREFPKMLELRPIVIDRNYMILGGNMRLLACREAGLVKVPVIIADQLTAEEQKEFIIKDNLGFGEWDYSLLVEEWDAQLLSEWGLELPEPKLESIEEKEYKSTLEVVVECENEREQQKVYEMLEKMGYTCRILSI